LTKSADRQNKVFLEKRERELVEGKHKVRKIKFEELKVGKIKKEGLRSKGSLKKGKWETRIGKEFGMEGKFKKKVQDRKV